MRLGTLLFLLFVITEVPSAQDSNFPVRPQYLMTNGSTMLFHPISTPTISLDAPLPATSTIPEVVPSAENQSGIPNPEHQNQPNLLPIYYGYPTTIDVEVTSNEEPQELPPSLNDVGFVAVTDAQSLCEWGYGTTLGEGSAFWKAHNPRVTRLLTNADVARLHGGE